MEDDDDDDDSAISAYCKLKLELKEAKRNKTAQKLNSNEFWSLTGHPAGFLLGSSGSISRPNAFAAAGGIIGAYFLDRCRRQRAKRRVTRVFHQMFCACCFYWFTGRHKMSGREQEQQQQLELKLKAEMEAELEAELEADADCD